MKRKYLILGFKIFLTLLTIAVSLYAGFIWMIMLALARFNIVLSGIVFAVIPLLVIPLIWIKRKKIVIAVWGVFCVAYALSLGIDYGIREYESSITINVTPNIRTEEYLPFTENSKIVKLRSEVLQLTDDLPVIDGAAAVFPVYSAFVNAVYPIDTRLYDECFLYNNTSTGYAMLAERKTDIFFGAYPSEEQIEYAVQNGTEFDYTQIGSEAFVFFVHKDNPVESLTEEQIRKIYSGEITNWKEVGGKNEKIDAFQRNEGSGSQSMLKRFMGDTPLADAPREKVVDMMSGIIDDVAEYKSRSSSIGFSFRYYVEGMIKNPDIKIIAVNGIAPTVENIKNGAYPIVTGLYAVSYKGNDNENVQKLIEWTLSDEGQRIIEETGYSGIK